MVLTCLEQPGRILGFYSLSSKQIDVSDLPPELTKKLPKYNSLGATLLGRFAIDEEFTHDKAPELRLASIYLLMQSQKYGTLPVVLPLMQ